jgi:hypothetical protein
MSILIIAGGGKFGKKALDYGIENKYKIILIDNDPNCFCSEFSTQNFDKIDSFYLEIEKIEPGQVFLLIHDISIIYELIVKFPPEYIIPVIPIHLSALIIKDFLYEKTNFKFKSDENSTIEFVNNVNKNILLTYNKEQGVAYFSYAKIEEICPDNCFGPENYCPNFNREKPITITQYVKNYFNLKNGFKIEIDDFYSIILVYESTQLMPGLGGLSGEDFIKSFKLLEKNLDNISKQNFSLIIATTCNCHGVINFYKNFIS